MRVPFRLSVAPFMTLLLAGALVAQAKNAPPAAKRALVLVNQLELAERRAAAADELLTLGEQAAPALAARLNDPRREVVQAVCEVLCALGPAAAAALPQLDTMIGSPDAAIVHMARLTGFRVRTTGATLVCECQPQRVVRIAADGAEEVVIKNGSQFGVEPLPDGHLLVAQHLENRVVELDAQGAEVWSFTKCLTPIRAHRLVNGHTLIVPSQGQRIIDVDVKGDVTWEWKSPSGTTYDADRLANGRTLVTLYPDRVVEIDRAGEVVWKLEDLEGVFEADRLPNGNTLLSLYTKGAVREVNAKGEAVWEIEIKGPRDADRLRNGNTLVASEVGVIEFGPDRKQIARLGTGTMIAEVTRH